MGKLLTYLKYEGLRETIRKCFLTVKNRNKVSETVFFKYCKADLAHDPKARLEVVFLTEERLPDFETIRFFDHISGRDYIAQPHGNIFLGYLNDELVAYAVTEYGKRKEIHGLGFFQLEQNEAWLGPVYVKRAYRGKGINREMLKRVIEATVKQGYIHSFYTCINQENVASIKSFSYAGFQKKGVILCQNGQYTCRLDEKIVHKFSAPDDPAKLDRH